MRYDRKSFRLYFSKWRYVINPTEAEAVRDYYDNYDLYFGNISAFKEKWNDVITAFFDEIKDNNIDVTEMIKKSLSILEADTIEHKKIIDEDTWNKVQAIIKSRK